MKQKLADLFMITLGAAIVAAAVFFFMMPLNITVGSGTALAMVLSEFLPLPVSVLTMLLNAVLLVLGFLLVGREFGAKTVYCAMVMPMILGVLELAFPNFQSLTNDPVLDVTCYILLVGVGLAILFPRNASSGGLDIVAKIINRYFRVDVGVAMAMSGIVVALCGAVCYDSKTVIVAVLGTYFGGLIVDHFIFGINIKRRVCIISPKLEEIREFIVQTLHSGASINEITGGYKGEPRREIIVIVDKNEYRLLMNYMKKTDPKAFITVYSVNEVSYQPKK